MSTRLFIGLLTFYVLAQIICNFVEGNNMVTNANIMEAQENLEHQHTVTVDTEGTEGSFVSKSINFITKVVFFDYSLFYDIDPVSGEKTANNLVILRYMLLAIGVVVLIELTITFRKALLGG
jgi:hypothetical protein